MIKNLNLEQFLSKNNITQSDWEVSGLEWELLEAIGKDHEESAGSLRHTAEFCASLIQTYDCVHSVRWRVKDTEHLLEKIVRKCVGREAKYLGISVENYHKVVTDLVGIRALHLFKKDCVPIDAAVRSIWSLAEKPIFYIRRGDEKPEGIFPEEEFEFKEHPKGYRSIHYVIQSQPIKKEVFAELQVRTIFEEGWSEIDHKIRYPNFSNNELVSYFLTIFNRLAGSSDEMGSFVKELTSSLQVTDRQRLDAVRERDQTLLQMDETLRELEEVKKQDQSSQDIIKRLKNEVNKLRGSSELIENQIAASSKVADPQKIGATWGRAANVLASALGVFPTPGEIGDMRKFASLTAAERASLTSILDSASSIEPELLKALGVKDEKK